MKSIKINILHTGRYQIEVYDDAYKGVDQGAGHISESGMVNSFDCGSAGLMVTLSKMIFEFEARAYEADRRKSSKDLEREALQKMLNDPTNADPRAQKLIQSRMK